MRQETGRLITLILLGIAAILIIIIGNQSGILQPITSVVMAPLRPVSRLLSDLTGDAVRLTDEREEYAILETQVFELEQLVAEMQIEIVELRAIEQDYNRVLGLLNYATDNPDQNLVAANVIARDTSSYLRRIIINRGTRDGIQIGNPVISHEGLVGRVEEVAANAAWVRLAIDPSSAISARLLQALAEGTVIGQLQGGLRMEYIPQEALIEIGDMVLTSGLGGTLPANIVIGQVTSVSRPQADPFQSAEVRPTVNFERLRVVSVITSFRPIDLTVFEGETQAGGSNRP
nr:rod shape-determining protein MreC [Anaerolineae bacterium]